MDVKKVITLGPDGTYASQGARMYFPGVKVDYRPTIYDVFNLAGVAVKAAKKAVYIVPLENSIEGTVRQSWDGVLDSKMKLFGIFRLPVHHVLASRAKDLKKIKRIVSHPQAIAQCRGFIAKNLKGADIEYVGSTAEAVERAKRSKKVAAISSIFACEQYGVPVLREKIEDEKGNSTIFGVIAGSDPYSDHEKNEMHIVVTPKKNMAGVLFNILKPFSDAGVDLTRLESRPTRKKMGEYKFLLSLRLEDRKSVEKVLKLLKKNYRVQILGESVSL
jgi:prephenate dehydratase